MTLERVRIGDIVECDHKQHVFLAYVVNVLDGGLEVDPITRGITWRRVSAREVTAHWQRRLARAGDYNPRARSRSNPAPALFS